MATAQTRPPDTASTATPLQRPSVLVILVVHDGARWIRQCLRSLSRQSHPRLGVMAVDSGSTDGSAELLEQALGPGRVLRLTEDVGFAGAVTEALATEVAHQADYVLLMHDDTVLAPDAVAGLVEAAQRIEGAGVVGPKVLDWDQPRRLLNIAMSTDRFGYPYSPLEEEEIDQGQYDRIREVLFVSSCAMLVSKDVWTRVGPPDERYVSHDEDPDFCWRARLAGYRIVVTPLAEASHKRTIDREHRAQPDRRHFRYQRERSALAAMLKNYSVFSLIVILPVYFALGIGRVLVFVGGRRFEDAAQLLAGWGWNLAHLPGTLRRRGRAQSVRTVRDRAVRRFMAPAGDRMRRVGAAVREALFPAPTPAAEEDAEEQVVVPFRVNLARFAVAHPVAMAWIVGTMLAAVAFRNVYTAPQLAGAALPAFPGAPSDFFRELVSGIQHTGLGGTQQASPALGWLGVASVVALGSPPLLQKVLLIALPALAGTGCYRLVRRLGGGKVPAVLGAATFLFTPLVLWAISEGRLAALTFLAGAPWVTSKLLDGFAGRVDVRPLRWVVACAVGVAILIVFYPGALLAAGLLVVTLALVPPIGRGRGRGTMLSAAGLTGAAVLAFPVTVA
ncbi:MAG: glycosyltransferase, partial [Actinomycetota bacterium]